MLLQKMIEVPYVNWRLYLNEKYQTKIKTLKKQKKSETHSGVCGADRMQKNGENKQK